MIKLIHSLYKAIINMIEHDGIEHSGYMSFMMLLSIFPFFIFILAFTGFLGVSQLGEKFVALALDNMPSHSIDSIKSRIHELVTSPPQSLLTLAIFGTIWTSSSFIECLRTILNRVYKIKSPPHYVFRRILSIVQFLSISIIISFAMFLLLITSIGIKKITQFEYITNHYLYLVDILKYILIFISLFCSVCTLYYMIPNIKLKMVEVMPGSVLTVLLWSISGYLLSKYIVYYRQLSIVYGSLASIIVTLVFFYIVNMIFIIGAEFNYLIQYNNKIVTL